MEKAPLWTPPGIAARSLSGTGLTLKDINCGPPPGFCGPLAVAGDALLPTCPAVEGWPAGWGGCFGAGSGGAEAASGTGGGAGLGGGGGSGTSRCGAGRSGSFDASSTGGGGGKVGKVMCGVTGASKAGSSRGLGGAAGGSAGGGVTAAFSGSGVGDLAGAGVGAGPPAIASGTCNSFTGLGSGGFVSFFRVNRVLSGCGGLETMVMRGSKWLAPNRGCAPGFTARPGALAAPTGLMYGR